MQELCRSCRGVYAGTIEGYMSCKGVYEEVVEEYIKELRRLYEAAV